LRQGAQPDIPTLELEDIEAGRAAWRNARTAVQTATHRELIAAAAPSRHGFLKIALWYS